mgnify:CR=1 FL=1
MMKKLRKKVLYIVVLFSLILLSCKSKDIETSYDYPPMIYWDNSIYYVQDINYRDVNEKDIEKKIGEITELLSQNKKPDKNGNSNIFEKGSPIYKIKAEDTKKIIAIKYKDEFYVAIIN